MKGFLFTVFSLRFKIQGSKFGVWVEKEVSNCRELVFYSLFPDQGSKLKIAFSPFRGRGVKRIGILFVVCGLGLVHCLNKVVRFFVSRRSRRFAQKIILKAGFLFLSLFSLLYILFS